MKSKYKLYLFYKRKCKYVSFKHRLQIQKMLLKYCKTKISNKRILPSCCSYSLTGYPGHRGYGFFG